MLFPTMFGHSRRECRDVTISAGPYAQHTRALFVTFRQKRERTPRCVVLTPNGLRDARVLVIPGHGHAALDLDPFGATGITRRTCYAPEWTDESSALASRYLAENGIEPIFDTFTA